MKGLVFLIIIIISQILLNTVFVVSHYHIHAHTLYLPRQSWSFEDTDANAWILWTKNSVDMSCVTDWNPMLYNLLFGKVDMVPLTSRCEAVCHEQDSITHSKYGFKRSLKISVARKLDRESTHEEIHTCTAINHSRLKCFKRSQKV